MSWPAGLLAPGGSAAADPSFAGCAAVVAYIQRCFHPRSRDRTPPCRPAQRTCQPRGNPCVVHRRNYERELCERDTPGSSRITRGTRAQRNASGKYVINPREIRCSLPSDNSIISADTGRTRNEMSHIRGPARYEDLGQRESHSPPHNEAAILPRDDSAKEFSTWKKKKQAAEKPLP